MVRAGEEEFGGGGGADMYHKHNLTIWMTYIISKNTQFEQVFDYSAFVNSIVVVKNAVSISPLRG